MISENLKSILGTRHVLRNFDDFIHRRGRQSHAEPEAAAVPAIQLRHIVYSPDDQPVIQDLSVTFALGKHYLIMGESGSGKSTVLNLLKGNIVPDSGTIALPAGVTQQDINVVDDSLFVFETSAQNNITLYDGARSTKVPQLLAAGNLPALGERPAATLSDGQKQRLAILRGLYFPSKVLLLDEVTSALDLANRERIEQLIFDHYQGTIISVMHHVDEGALKHYDTRITIAAGRVTGVEDLHC
nr:ATP-binding cassette domain-containing protein [Schleiferilactobacillus shenzhenensis]